MRTPRHCSWSIWIDSLGVRGYSRRELLSQLHCKSRESIDFQVSACWESHWPWKTHWFFYLMSMMTLQKGQTLLRISKDLIKSNLSVYNLKTTDPSHKQNRFYFVECTHDIISFQMMIIQKVHISQKLCFDFNLVQTHFMNLQHQGTCWLLSKQMVVQHRVLFSPDRTANYEQGNLKVLWEQQKLDKNGKYWQIYVFC